MYFRCMAGYKELVMVIRIGTLECCLKRICESIDPHHILWYASWRPELIDIGNGVKTCAVKTSPSQWVEPPVSASQLSFLS